MDKHITKQTSDPGLLGSMKLERCSTITDPLSRKPHDSELNEDHHCLLANPTIEISIDPSNQSSAGLCHCCLELTCQKSLWQTYKWMGCLEIYGEMLKECFSLDLSKQHNAKICEVCVTQLRNAVRFRAQVARCQTQLGERRDVKTDDQESAQRTKTVEREIKLEHIGETVDPDDQDAHYGNQLISRKSPKSEYTSDESCNAEDLKKIKTNKRIGGRRRIIQVKKNTQEISDKLMKIKTSKGIKGRKKIIQIKRSYKVDRRTIAFQSSKFTRPRRNVGLVLEHSTICPFKYSQAYFKCFYCTKNFLVFQELRSHVKEYHNNLAFIDIAKCITRPNDQVKADISEISCKNCLKNFKNLEELASHLSIAHSVMFDGNPADSIVGYDLSNNKFKCTVCKEEFLFFKTLGKHMNDHATSHVCDICGKCFLLIERLRSHVQLHSEISIKCVHCDKNFLSKPSLNSHIRYTHERKPFPCSICSETFPTYRKRLQHFVEKHGRAPLSVRCDQCDRTFSSNSSLNHHVKYQHLMIPKEAKYTCEDCGRKFKTKRVLSGHMLVHSGEKNFECDVCKKKFGRQNSLKEHLKIHRNDKRWTCGVCAVCFVQKCSLKNHIRVHHAEYNMVDLIVYKNPDK